MAEPLDQANPLRPGRLPGGGRARQEWLLLGAVLLAVALLGLWSRYGEYRSLDAEQRLLLQVQATAIDMDLSSQLASANAALRGLRDDLASWRADELVPRAGYRLRALGRALPGLRALVLLDREGRAVASSRPELVGRDFRERDYFQRARAQPDVQRLSLSSPFTSALGVYTMTLTLTVLNADGSFGGVIVASLDPEHLRSMVRSSVYAPDVWSAVVHGDGVVMMIEPHDASAVGVNLAERAGSFFLRHRDAGQVESVLTGTVSTAGGPRLMAQRTVRPPSLSLDKPIVVAVSRSQRAIFAPWWRQTGTDALLFALLCVATSIALMAIQRRQRAVDEFEARRAASDRRAAERLDLALRGADLGLWDLDVRSGSTTVNERWNSMLGLPHQAVHAGVHGWSSRVHPDDLDRVVAVQQAHMAGHSERFEETFRMRHADSHWVWILDRGQVLERDAQGNPLRMLGTHMDISERMREQLKLASSEQSLATTLQSIGDAVIATDPQGRVERMNATAERLTGWAVSDAIGQPMGSVFRIVNARTREPALDPVRHVLERGEIVGLANDTVLIARDGREYQIADSAAPIRTPDGAITGVVLVFSDVTERYLVQQALRANEERLRSLLDNLGSGVIVHGPDSRVLDANPSACRIVGLTLDQLQCKASIDPHWAFLAEDGTAMSLDQYPVPQVLARGEAVKNLVLGVRRPDLERPLWVLVHAYPVRDADERFVQVVVTFTDISERKQAEVERQVLERQLREAQKIESIGTLAGGIAHDFNNILAAILGNVALARADVPPGHPVIASLDQINRAGLRARHLVQQILTFSRHDQRGLVLQPLRPVVEETLDLLRSTLPAGVRLHPVLPDAPLAVHGDATQLQQVLLNLCTNAWHALPEHGGHIEVGFERTAQDDALRQRVPDLPPGACVHLWVRDNGSGMDEATRLRIFDPFFTTKRVGQGTGLGLSVVHGIVQAHGGAITLDTAPGQGTTFHVYLPLPEADAAEPASELALPVEPLGAGQHVLYIDDDEVMVAMVERLLLRAGFRVTAETDAATALEKLRAHPQDFAVVVTDFNMPGLSGLEVAEQIARLHPGLPVVISSGFLSDALRSEAGHLGVRALMQKENTFEELAVVLQRLLTPPSA